MDSIKLMPMLCKVLQSVGLDELKGVTGLGVDVRPNYLIEPGPMIAHRGSTSPAE
tara:strand:- start:212 stop:376 length:165 start_codon:yes stop_codon:yes gene_type:complete